MCGLVGMASTFSMVIKEKKAFSDLLFMDQLRGPHSTGMFTINSLMEVEILKRAVDAVTFLDTKKYGKISSGNNIRVMAGHNRFATMGGISHCNAHPFECGDITLMHNGTLKTLANLQDVVNFDTDSEAIAHNLSLVEPENAGEVISKLHGAFALVWYDSRDKTINFIRNSQRPLYFGTSDKTFKRSKYLLWASEIDMISIGTERNGIAINQWVDVPEMLHYKFDISGQKLKLETKEYKEYEPPAYNTYSFGGNNYSNDGRTGNKWPPLPNYNTNNSNIKDVPDHFPKRGEVLELEKVSWIPYPAGGRGKAHFLAESPSNSKDTIDCVVHNISKEEYGEEGKEGKVIFGTILNQVYDRTLGVFILIMVHINSQAVPDKSDNKEKEISQVILGPNRTMVTLKKFDEITKDGCAYCSRDLAPNEAEYIEWIDSNTPICCNCVTEECYNEIPC